MSSNDDPRLCYAKDADDRFRTYYVDLGGHEFSSPGAEALLDGLDGEDFQRKLGLVDQLFSTRMKEGRRIVDRWNAPDASSIYDVRYQGKPNTRHLYDILFLPGFTKPAFKLSISVADDHVRKLDWNVYTAREFSAIDVGLYQDRFRILKEDRAAVRLSNIEIMKDRLTPEGFSEWLEKARFAD